MDEDRSLRAAEYAAKTRKWREDDPDRARASVRASHRKNKPKRQAYDAVRDKTPKRLAAGRVRGRAWKQAHPDKVKQYRIDNAASLKVYLAEYCRSNPDKYREYRHRRRARLAEVGGDFTAEDVADIRRLQRDRCAICAGPLKGKGAVDHIKAIVNGGTNDRRNLQLVHGPCNSMKRDKDAIEFMQSLGRLL